MDHSMNGRRGFLQVGFTLTELVVVILLLGIVSTYAATRYSGVSGFSAFAAQEQAIAIIRQIQLGRMQVNLDTLNYAGNESQYQLQISGGVCLGSGLGCGNENRSNFLLIQDQGFAFTPADMTVRFDLLGVPTCSTGCVTPVPGASAPADRITIRMSNGVETTQVCINSQGFVNGC